MTCDTVPLWKSGKSRTSLPAQVDSRLFLSVLSLSLCFPDILADIFGIVS